ncbi:hypothetical protein G9A89_000755 [Geosiphon pyriformis]|nr:hypothetical protein G9A89_000755 [Geosiphon pyriformis]
MHWFGDIAKTIDYMFVSSNLVSALVHCNILDVSRHFNTDYYAVFVLVSLDGLLDTKLNFLLANAALFSNEFASFVIFFDMDSMWNVVHKASLEKNSSGLISLIDHWISLDPDKALAVQIFLDSGANFDCVRSAFFGIQKFYRASKLAESLRVQESNIRSVIDRHMESFASNKGHTIKSILKCSFHKMELDHLVVGDKLILESDLVKTKMDMIMEGWTKRHGVVSDISSKWSCQYQPLEYVFDDTFSNAFEYLCGLQIGVLTNTHPIALIEMTRKIFSKILSDRISLACSTFNVLHGDNFSVLKDITTQLPIFAVGSVIEDALEKNSYNSVSWEHLKNSLIRIKMCDKFIHFFGSIHCNCVNRVMTDFGLTDGYYVHNGLDQGEVFLPLLWHIFYDPLLCEVKRQKSVCEYRLNSNFILKNGHPKSSAGLFSFFAAGTFINNIYININKMVAIPINCRVVDPSLSISGLPIAIPKKGESHHYLGIFLSTNGLLKPSLAKVQSDIQFFSNLVLRKTISNKQFLYLVLAVLLFIVSYRTQFSFVPISMCNKWDALIRKDLKLKSGLLLDFSSYLFLHRSHDLQVSCWHPIHPLSFLACICINGVLMLVALGESVFCACLFSFHQYGIAFVDQLCDYHGEIFDWKTFKCWKKLDLHGPVPNWFSLSVAFLNNVTFLSVCSSFFEGVGDSSLKDLGTISRKAGAAVFFEDIGLDLEVKVSVCLYSDSQTALDACKSELHQVCSDFHNWYWVEHQHVVDIIHSRNLRVEWLKVKNHSGTMENDRADVLTANASLSDWFLSFHLKEHCLVAEDDFIFGNSRHFIHDIFRSVHWVHWEVGSGSKFLIKDLLLDVD